MSRRRVFLEAFLGALGAEEIIITSIKSSSVDGIVVYDQADPEERQEFRWHMTEDDIPASAVFQLIQLLNDDDLLDIDRIRVSRQELLSRYNLRFATNLSEHNLANILTELEAVYVAMVDDGEEGDGYFIHE